MELIKFFSNLNISIFQTSFSLISIILSLSFTAEILDATQI